MDQDTVRLLCIIGYVVVGAVGLYTVLTFIIIAVHFRDLSPGILLKELSLDGPKPRGATIYPDILECLAALAAFWICWHYAGDAQDMPHHVLRVAAYVVGSWVVCLALLIAYSVLLRVLVRWRWEQAHAARQEQSHVQDGTGRTLDF